VNRDPRSVLVKPLMTEKSMQQKEELNAITFKVSVGANKVEIRQAVEKVFNVKVATVRTASHEGKWKRMGKFEGRRPAWKKAVVTLVPGHKIDLVEGA
jgi:large subunit ribosomal protein L23